MWNQTHLDRLGRVLKFDLKFLCPWKGGFDNLRTSKLFLAYCLSSLILPLIMLSFIFYYWDTLLFLAIAENLATALVFSRAFGYALLMKTFYGEYKNKVENLLSDRSLALKSTELTLTERYCKVEFVLAVSHHLCCYFLTFFLLHFLVYLLPNAYQLPFNCYVTFMPPEDFLFAWELNYLAITFTASFIGLTKASYLPLPFILMDHSCWHLDMALITAAELNEDLQPNEDIRDSERVVKTNENLKKLVERCEKFVEWQNEVQDLLFWYFNLEFQVQSMILCLSIYVLSLTIVGGGIALVVFVFCAIQLFVMCWMGTRITGRIDQLSFEISQNWYLMTPKQRKTLQMILHWTQNMEGFSGLFSDVSLDTCKAIFEAAYSFYTFLQSTSEN